ncbi:MAG: peptidase [Bacteroidia bacterium]|nr:MAG: peptidase [Bacteroidia bacterium]
MPPILLVPIPPLQPETLATLARGIVERFQIAVLTDGSKSIDPAPAYDASRNQYDSSLLLSILLRLHSAQNGKILAVTEVDLYIPVLTFVFGEAQLDGKAAIVSVRRLDERFYGLPEKSSLLEDRLLKEAIHELGHTFGLLHCRRFECVMHASTAVEEIDLKSSSFCPECARLLDQKNRMGENG